MSKKRKINLTLYATEEQQKSLENYLETTDMSFLYIENDLGMDTNFRVLKDMSVNEFADFLLASERITIHEGLTWNNKDIIYNWLTSLYDESDTIWEEARHLWDN